MHRDQATGRFGGQPDMEAHGGTDMLTDQDAQRPLGPGDWHPDDADLVGEDGDVVLFRPHRQPPGHVSFSTLTTFDICPAQHAYGKIDQADPSSDIDTKDRDVGVGVHEVLDRMAQDRDATVDEVVDTVVADDPGLKEHADDIAEARALYPRQRRVVEVNLDSETGRSRRASARMFVKAATR